MMNTGEESFIKDELTLPIDFEKSGRMSILGNLANSDETLTDERKNMQKTPTQPYSSMPNLSSLPPNFRIAGLRSVNGGDGQPAVARNLTPLGVGRPMSLKEYEQQLNDLKKENFNLKLRIYFLENKLPKIDGVSGEDLLKKNLNLQIEIESLKDDTERKERLVQETLLAAKHAQINHARELEECRQEAEDSRDKDRQELIRCSSHLTALRGQFDEIGKILMEKEAENRRLKEMVDSNNPTAVHFSESDSDISLLSEKERLIINLKTQIVHLERQISEQKQKFDEDLRLINEQQAKNESKFSCGTHPDSTDNQVVPANQINKVNNVTVWLMQPQAPGLNYTGYETGPIIPSPELENKLIDLQKQLEEKNINANHLDEQLQTERLEMSKKIDEIVSLRRDLQTERENGVKRDKIIQGLLKNIENLSSKQQLNRTEYDLDGVSALSDPSLMFESHVGLPENQQMEDLKRKLVELETGRENLYERIRRVAESLLQFAEILGGDAGNTLSALSMDLSKMQDGLGDVSTNLLPFEEHEAKLRSELKEKYEKIEDLVKLLKEKEDAESKFHSETAEAQAKLSEFSNILKEKENVESKLRRLLSEKDEKLNDLVKLLKQKETVESELRSEVIGKEEKYKNDLMKILYEKENSEKKFVRELTEMREKMNDLVESLNEKETIETKLRSELVNTDENLVELERILHEKETIETEIRQELLEMDKNLKDLRKMLNQRDTVIEDLSHKNEKLERYGKILKLKYRKLESRIQPKNDSSDTKNDRVVAEVEHLLVNEHYLEGIVRDLEDNNKILAERVELHGQADERMKQEAVKMKALKTKIVNYEKKIGKKEEI